MQRRGGVGPRHHVHIRLIACPETYLCAQRLHYMPRDSTLHPSNQEHECSDVAGWGLGHHPLNQNA